MLGKIFDFVKGELIEVIEWVDDTRDTLVWKFPDKDKQIKMGAQLTVRESQVAIMINEGKMADVYLPGRHELTTRNMPLLTTIKSWKHGFESPFKVDIYFVSTREFSNMRWGTKQPIMVSDPEFMLVQLRAFGTFNFQVKDAAQFFRNFAGTDSHVTTDELLEHFRSTVVTEFSSALKRSGKTLIEINSRANELGADLQPLLEPEFAKNGLALTRFNVESVSLPEEIQAELTKQDFEFRQRRRSQNIDNEAELQRMINQANLSQNIGDMQKFMQFQAGMGMNNPSSSGGGGGGDSADMMKMMMQMQMAQQMMQNMPGMNNNAPVNTPPPVQQVQNTAPPAGDNMTQEQVMASLKQLGELKTAGILTDEEFESKKKELLARL
jgi:membrane protease subunit (stomatin/prohibitin family)